MAKTSEIDPYMDQVMGKGYAAAEAADKAFGSDFVIRRRKLSVQGSILRLLARNGRQSFGKILSGTSRLSLPVAEALADLAEQGLVTYRRDKAISIVPLADLMPSLHALEKVRGIIAQTASHASLRTDPATLARIQERIDALEATHGV